jgi:Immunoglobulin domain/Immunoglobulin I-set domain
VLAIEAVTTDDAGTYKCSASNAGGEASAELKLTVATSMQVEISPNVLSVNMGGSTEFRCLVTSNGAQISSQQITWFKDGRQLPTSGRNGDTLLLSSVGREDKGMYQCVVRRPEGDTFQASAELQLGGEQSIIRFTWRSFYGLHQKSETFYPPQMLRPCCCIVSSSKLYNPDQPSH